MEMSTDFRIVPAAGFVAAGADWPANTEPARPAPAAAAISLRNVRRSFMALLM
jgi:hypothetical protein